MNDFHYLVDLAQRTTATDVFKTRVENLLKAREELDVLISALDFDQCIGLVRILNQIDTTEHRLADLGGVSMSRMAPVVHILQVMGYSVTSYSGSVKGNQLITVELNRELLHDIHLYKRMIS